MDALKLYGKKFLVDVLSQLESYNVWYNQFDNTTFRLDWFLGVLDRFSPTNLEDKVIIDRLIAQLQQVKAIVVQLDQWRSKLDKYGGPYSYIRVYLP